MIVPARGFSILLHQGLSLARFAGLPWNRENVASLYHRLCLQKQEQAMSMLQVLTRFLYSLNPLSAGGDGQHAKPLPAEPGAMKVLRPGCFVGE